MSIISQAAMILLIIMTGVILVYANKGLANAAEEGEHFVDEWALRKRKEEERLKLNPFNQELRESLPVKNFVEEIREEQREEEIKMEEPKTEDPSPKAIKPFELVLRNDDKQSVESITVDHLPYTIGRDSKNDLVLNDLYVARFHCQIEQAVGCILVKDKGTANKIFANGNMVDEVRLDDNSRFYIGGYELSMKKNSYRSDPTILARKN